MSKKCLLISALLCAVFAACGTMQSIVRTSVPYTTPLIITASAQTGKNLTAVGTASSFDQIIFGNGGNVNRINAVKVVSAELKSALPADFDLGHVQSLKIYMLKADESESVLVASKANVPADAGNIITLDINNSGFLDKFIREPDIRIKMIYTLRNQVPADANLLLVMHLNATPVK